MLRQQRRQRQPSRFNDFVDLPPQKKTRRTGEDSIVKPPIGLQQHTSDPKPKVHKIAKDFFKSAAGCVVESPLYQRQAVNRDGLTEQPAILEDGGLLRDKMHLYVCPEELVTLSGSERIQYLQNKLHQIRTYYASLKSEVESIDRRRKRMKKKRRREGSTTPASTSVSSGSSDMCSSPSHNTHTLMLF